MATIQFYHLTASPLERALPRLLETILGRGMRVCLLAESEAQVERLNQLLWTYDPGSFLPHGSAKDGHADAQPVFLSTAPEAPNGAKVLLVTGGVQVDNPEGFERIADMFDGGDLTALEAARLRWKHYKNAGHSLAYMQQTESGSWQQKAVA